MEQQIHSIEKDTLRENLPEERSQTVEDPRKLYRTCLGAGVLLVLLVTVCKTAMLGLAYDYEMRFFERGIPLYLLEGLVAVTTLFAVAGLFLFRKSDFGRTLPSPGSAETLFSALCGFFLFATVIMQVIYTVSGLELGRYTVENSYLYRQIMKFTGGQITGKADLGQTLHSLAILCAIPGGIYFLYAAFSERPKKKKRAILGLFFLLWALFCLLVVNFDMVIPMNSPERLGPLTAFLAVMLFATAEVRFHLGKGKISLLYCAGMLALLFGFSDGLPTLLYSFAGRLEMGVSTIYACAELSIAVYALLRLRSFRHPDPMEEDPRATELVADESTILLAQPVIDEQPETGMPESDREDSPLEIAQQPAPVVEEIDEEEERQVADPLSEEDLLDPIVLEPDVLEIPASETTEPKVSDAGVSVPEADEPAASAAKADLPEAVPEESEPAIDAAAKPSASAPAEPSADESEQGPRRRAARIPKL